MFTWPAARENALPPAQLAAAARILGGRVVSLERDPAKVEAWRRNIADAGLEEWAEVVEGDARQTLPALEDGFDLVFLDAWKEDDGIQAYKAGEDGPAAADALLARDGRAWHSLG